MVIWELFEFGSQPHRHLSDDEVLTFVIRERQITLAQPRLKLSHADYWSVDCTEKTMSVGHSLSSLHLYIHPFLVFFDLQV